MNIHGNHAGTGEANAGEARLPEDAAAWSRNRASAQRNAAKVPTCAVDT